MIWMKYTGEERRLGKWGMVPTGAVLRMTERESLGVQDDERFKEVDGPEPGAPTTEAIEKANDVVTCLRDQLQATPVEDLREIILRLNTNGFKIAAKPTDSRKTLRLAIMAAIGAFEGPLSEDRARAVNEILAGRARAEVATGEDLEAQAMRPVLEGMDKAALVDMVNRAKDAGHKLPVNASHGKGAIIDALLKDPSAIDV